MSRETEKMNKALQKFLDANTTEKTTEDEMDSLIQVFIKEYNKMNENFVLDARTAKTSDDFFELAKMTEDLSLSLKYAKKSLKLNPENLDAAFFSVEIEADSYVDMLERNEKILEYGEKIMIEKGFMDEENIGSFWLIVETRPYMRVKFAYANLLKECGMLSTAISEYEDMMRLCKNDNLGVRHSLMYLYAATENEKKAAKLYKKFEFFDSSLILPLSILYYRKKDLKESLKYLKELEEGNKDTKKFLKFVYEEKIDKILEEINDIGYRAATIEELAISFAENNNLFNSTLGYVEWAYNQLRKKVKKTVKIKKK